MIRAKSQKYGRFTGDFLKTPTYTGVPLFIRGCSLHWICKGRHPLDPLQSNTESYYRREKEKVKVTQSSFFPRPGPSPPRRFRPLPRPIFFCQRPTPAGPVKPKASPSIPGKNGSMVPSSVHVHWQTMWLRAYLSAFDFCWFAGVSWVECYKNI